MPSSAFGVSIFVPIDCLSLVSVFSPLLSPSSFHLVQCTQYERKRSASVFTLKCNCIASSFFFLPFYQLNSGGKCRYCQTDRRQQTEKCTCLLKDAFLFHWSDITWTFVCHCFVPFIVFKSSLQLELANWIAFSEETQFLYLASTTPHLLSCSVEINMVDFVSWYCKLAWSVESWLYLVIASTESVGRMDMSGARPDVENGSSLGKYMGA